MRKTRAGHGHALRDALMPPVNSRPRHRGSAGHRPRNGIVRTLLVVGTMILAGQSTSSAAWLSTSAITSVQVVQAGSLGAPTAPTASQIAGGHTVQLSWSAVTTATSYELRHHIVASGGTPTVACTTSSLTCVDSVSRTGSAHWYSVVARIGTNWVSESARVQYTSDDATTVTISSMASDSGTSSSDFITNVASTTLTGTSEAGDTIAVKRSGTTIATATANGSGNWTSTSFTLNEGLQNLDAVATDAYANTATATRTNVRLDTVAPVTSQSATCGTVGNAAPSGFWCKQTTLSMTATFSDAASGLLAGTSEYNNNGGGWTAYSGAVSMAEANGRVMQLHATDIAGNVGTTSVTYYIDGTAPSLVVTSPPAGLSLSLALLGSNCGGKTACGTSSDATSGLASVASVKWELKKGSQCLLASGSYGTCGAYQDAIGTLPNWTTATTGGYTILTSYVLTVQSTDVAGNVTTVTRSFSTIA